MLPLAAGLGPQLPTGLWEYRGKVRPWRPEPSDVARHRMRVAVALVLRLAQFTKRYVAFSGLDGDQMTNQRFVKYWQS